MAATSGEKVAGIRPEGERWPPYSAECGPDASAVPAPGARPGTRPHSARGRNGPASGPAAPHHHAHDQPRPPPLPRLLPEADAALPAHRPGGGLLALRRRTGGPTSTPSGGAFVVNVGHGVREIADGDRPAGGAAGLRERHRVHQRSGRGVRRGDRPALPRRPRAGLSARERVRGGRGRAQARPAVLGRGRRAGPAEDRRALARLSRQHAPRALRVRPRALQDLLSATGWSSSSGCRRPTPTAASAAASPPLCPSCSGEAVEAAHRARGPRHGRGGDRRAGRRLVDRRLGAGAGVLAPGPRGLRPARRPAHRRRGADRRRPDRHLVRAGAVRCGAGHHDAGEGHRRRLRPALRGRGPAADGRRAGARLGRLAARPDVLASCDALRRPAWPRCGTSGSTR